MNRFTRTSEQKKTCLWTFGVAAQRRNETWRQEGRYIEKRRRSRTEERVSVLGVLASAPVIRWAFFHSLVYPWQPPPFNSGGSSPGRLTSGNLHLLLLLLHLLVYSGKMIKMTKEEEKAFFRTFGSKTPVKKTHYPCFSSTFIILLFSWLQS